jgi:Transglycosylase SLT domain
MFFIKDGIMEAKGLDLNIISKRGVFQYGALTLIALCIGICGYQQYRILVEFQAVESLSRVYQILASGHTGDRSEEGAARVPADGIASESADGTGSLDEGAGSPHPFHAQILQAAQTYDVDPSLIKAVIQTESSYNPNAVSTSGAQGLMQLMPATARWLGIEDSFDPAMNIDGGVRYLKLLLDRFGGNVKLALAAYNAGSRYVRKYKGVPPFPTTRIYIKKVLKCRERFEQELLAQQSAT